LKGFLDVKLSGVLLFGGAVYSFRVTFYGNGNYFKSLYLDEVGVHGFAIMGM
jgi:hypothetical protein